jgi:hypothetical protein
MELNSGSSPLSNITNTMDARHNAKKFEGKPVKRQLSLEGFLVNKKQKTGADENILMSPDTKDKVIIILRNDIYCLICAHIFYPYTLLYLN